MSKVRVAINGFGRIGRVFFRNAVNNPLIDIIAINDVADTATLAHLLKYDSVHRAFNGEIKTEGKDLVVNGKKIKIVSAKDPAQLPWKEN
ncbi:MAG: glyceraldehyde 3-phosphate dehydrogenase NAD-binding domain-containing protein, partial [Bacteroidia bacterium]